jgi:Kef-type K+ transport system membrane component KefB
MSFRILLLMLCLASARDLMAAGAGSEYSDPVTPILLALILILGAAKLGAEVFERLGMPAVLGELVAGVLLGNIALAVPGFGFFEPLRTTPIQADWAMVIDALSRLGVILLLFEVGLESTVKGMLKVGPSALLVAVLGVIAPAALGFGVSWALIREVPSGVRATVPAGFSLNYIHLFIGTVLCATSVGITARVFKDLRRLHTPEAQIILGAAVIDDVLGLMVLAVVSGIVKAAETGQPMEPGSVLILLGTAVLFLGGSLVAGVFVVPRMMTGLAKMRTSGMMLTSALVFAFIMSYLAHLAGLAPIVGAFAAGLLLEDVHFQGFREKLRIEELIRPVASFLVPVFFVLMGIQVRLETFADPSVLGVAAGLTIAAVAGKQVCGLGLLEKGLDRLSVGVGMIPRGEVGLIFAGIGKGLGVIDDAVFSAVVIMVIITTLATPPLLKLSLNRKKPRLQNQHGI